MSYDHRYQAGPPIPDAMPFSPTTTVDKEFGFIDTKLYIVDPGAVPTLFEGGVGTVTLCSDDRFNLPDVADYETVVFDGHGSDGDGYYLNVIERQAEGVQQPWPVGTFLASFGTAYGWEVLSERVNDTDNTFRKTHNQGFYNVKDWGAVGDGVNDDSAVVSTILAALGGAAQENPDVQGLAQGGTIYFPPGKYKLSFPISLSHPGITLVGASIGSFPDINEYLGGYDPAWKYGFGATGPAASILIIDHTDGPAILVSKGNCAIRNLYIEGTDTRWASTNLWHGGVYIIPPETAEENRINSFRMIDCGVYKHPGHGVGFAGGVIAPLIDGVVVRDVKGHGFCFDNGSLFGRDPEYYARQGQVQLTNCRSYWCGGHSICMGNEGYDRAPYRCKIHNCDCNSGNMHADATLRRAPADVWLNGEELNVTGSAISGRLHNDGPGDGVPDRACMYISGQNIVVDNNRFVSTGDYCIIVGSQMSKRDTKAIYIANNYIAQDSGLIGQDWSDPDTELIAYILFEDGQTVEDVLLIDMWNQRISKRPNPAVFTRYIDNMYNAKHIRVISPDGIQVFNPKDPSNLLRVESGDDTGQAIVIVHHDSGNQHSISGRENMGFNTDGDMNFTADGSHRIHSLPTSSSGLLANSVWRDNNGFLRIT